MTDTPPPDESPHPKPGDAGTPAESAPQPAPSAPPPGYAIAPFPPVVRTPWINPAKRMQVAILSIVAFLVVAGAAFAGGVAAGGDGHGRDRRGPEGFGYQCMHAGAGKKSGWCMGGGPLRIDP